MALDTPSKLTKRRHLAYALETTTGTAASLTAANSVTPIFNPAMPWQTEAVARENQGSLSPVRQGRGARGGSCNFETELYGDEDADFVKLFRMCGLALASNVLTPTSQPSETGTIGLYQHGRLKTLVGCMGTAAISFRRGQAPRIRWSFTGVQGSFTDTTFIAPTKVTTIAPRVGGTFTIGTATYLVDNVDFDLGAQVILREDVTSTTGYRAAFITDRAPRIRLAPEALPLATRDWVDFYHSSTTAALVLTVGAAGNGWQLDAPKLELATDPADGDRAGLLTDVLEFVPLANSDAGDDEYSLTAIAA